MSTLREEDIFCWVRYTARLGQPIHKRVCGKIGVAVLLTDSSTCAAWWLEVLLGAPSELSSIRHPACRSHSPCTQPSFTPESDPGPLLPRPFIQRIRGCMRNRHHLSCSSQGRNGRNAVLRMEQVENTWTLDACIRHYRSALHAAGQRIRWLGTLCHSISYVEALSGV
jgi:hypothetical protein